MPARRPWQAESAVGGAFRALPTMTTAPTQTSHARASGPDSARESAREPACFALLGNPNTGKTTLFNRLCGLRSKTSNFPGSTVEAHVGNATIAARSGQGAQSAHIVDLPGIYSLHLHRPESPVVRDYLEGRLPFDRRPEALLIIADATNLGRNLVFAAEALRLGL